MLIDKHLPNMCEKIVQIYATEVRFVAKTRTDKLVYGVKMTVRV